jgi:hypothetical protein
MFLVGLILVYFMKEKLNRSESEKRSSQSRISGETDIGKQINASSNKGLKEQLLVTVKLTNEDDNVLL